jgi:hypothetical protein
MSKDTKDWLATMRANFFGRVRGQQTKGLGEISSPRTQRGAN